MHRHLLTVVLIGTLLVTACSAPRMSGAVAPKESPAHRYHGAWQGPPLKLPELACTDTSGQVFNLRTTPSRPVTLVYFGYPDCPQMCDNALTGLTAALDRLTGGARDDIEVLVIDIAPDPAKAHQQRLRTWLDGFDRDFVGLTAPADQVHRVARDLGVEIHPPDAEGVIVHGDQVIGFDRDGNGVVVWTPDLAVTDMAADLAVLVATQR